MSRGGKNRTLSDEERELWARVTKNDQPLEPAPAQRKPSAIRLGEEAHPPQEAKPEIDFAALLSSETGINGKSRTAKSSRASRLPHAASRSDIAAPQPFDHRLSRKIARGRRQIDAKLDLHGLRQSDALSALKRFLLLAQANGYRHVLIITGKGSSAAGETETPYWLQGERGILKRRVPEWLRSTELSPLVVSFTDAAQHHGGNGALYVTVRRRNP
jgi:DNA-nicking Smr family endonuclease